MIPLGSCSFGWAKMPLELTTITELRDPSEGLFVAGDLATRRVDAPVVAGGGIGSAPGARLSAAGPEPLRWARARRSIVHGFSEGTAPRFTSSRKYRSGPAPPGGRRFASRLPRWAAGFCRSGLSPLRRISTRATAPGPWRWVDRM